MPADQAATTKRSAYRVTEGDVIAGKYVVEKIIAEGGMGVVLAARHTQLNDRVAIKLLASRSADSADLIERLEREAQVAVRIKTEHVVRVFDVGVLEGGIPYIVMEHLEGRDLACLLEREGRLPPAEAVDYVLQACVAVAEAHALGIVHRDLKPSNLLLTTRRDGRRVVKVLDFGVSKSLLSERQLTASGAFVGSPSYMSPEQMTLARSVDTRADIWSLGVTLFELLSEELPFAGDSVPQICLEVTQGQPRSLSELGVKVHPALESAVASCLERDPALRPQTVAALAAALEPHGSAAAKELVGQIARLQRYSSESIEQAPEEAESRAGSPTVASAGQTQGGWWNGLLGPRASVSRLRAVGVMLAFVVGAAIAGSIGLAMRARTVSDDTLAPSSRVAAPSGAVAPSRSASRAVAVAGSAGEPTRASALVASANSASPKPSAVAGAARAGSPRRSAAGAGAGKAAPRPRPDLCRDPRYLDKDGIVRIRRECLTP